MSKFIDIDKFDEVILPKIKQYIDEHCNTCVDIPEIQTLSGEKLSPDDYRVDTGLKLNYGYKYEVKAKNASNFSSTSLIDAGASSGDTTATRPRMGFVIYNKSNPMVQAWVKGNGSQDFFNSNVDWEHEYIITLDNIGMTLTQNGVTQSSNWNNTPATGEDDYPIYLLFNTTLAAEQGGVSYGPADVYYIKIYDTDHITLLREFIPSYNRRTAKYGFYDKVEDKFYEVSATRANSNG